MKYRQKRQQELPHPFIKIDQPGHAHLCVNYQDHTWRVFTKTMKFHDNNQNNTQYVRIKVKV